VDHHAVWNGIFDQVVWSELELLAILDGIWVSIAFIPSSLLGSDTTTSDSCMRFIFVVAHFLSGERRHGMAKQFVNDWSR
jgi:hypothetical protein